MPHNCHTRRVLTAVFPDPQRKLKAGLLKALLQKCPGAFEHLQGRGGEEHKRVVNYSYKISYKIVVTRDTETQY